MLVRTISSCSGVSVERVRNRNDERLRSALAALLPPGSPGAIVRVDRCGATLMELAVGEVAAGSGQPLTTHHSFRLASATTPITAATVLRLQEQGHLDIDESIADYLPADLVDRLHGANGVRRGGHITIRHLLGHTSGLFDRKLDTPFFKEVISNPGRVWQPRELVDYGIAHAAPMFAPGTDFSYSDDDYLLLHMIIEAATSQPLHVSYRHLVLDPLGMDATYHEGQEVARGRELSHPYLGDLDAIAVHPSAQWGGGGLVSTVADLIRFGTAIVEGTLFEHDETLQEMLHDPGTGYGLGIYVSPTPNRLTIVGHDGYWGSVVLVVPELNLIMAATTNQFIAPEVKERFFSDLINLVPTRPVATSPVRWRGGC